MLLVLKRYPALPENFLKWLLYYPLGDLIRVGSIKIFLNLNPQNCNLVLPNNRQRINDAFDFKDKLPFCGMIHMISLPRVLVMPVFLEPPACAKRTKQINGIQDGPVDPIPLHLFSTIVTNTEPLMRFFWSLRNWHRLFPFHFDLFLNSPRASNVPRTHS